MAERRKNKKKKEADVKIDDKPSKDEYTIAKYLKQSLPEKKTTLLGHKVEYFIAAKAVDLLVESQWAKDNKKGELNFSNRDVAIDFMARLLEHKFFHRAKKIVVQKEPKKKKKETEEPAQEEKESVEKENKKSSKKVKSETVEKSETAEKSEVKDTPKEKEVVEKKKEKKKIKLDMHLEQIFIDSNEPYVWIYDPIPLRTWITGTLMVIAAVLLCLFPLWPQTIRHYIYYLSVAAACFLVFIIGLAVLRLIVFVLLWIVTFGKHHLWLLPNLTEDVGFFESFWPLYHYEYKGSEDKSSKTKEKKLSKDKPPKDEVEKEDNKEVEESQGEEDKNPEQTQSESEKSEEGEAHKTDNGFEFLEAEEASESPAEEEDRKTK